MTNSNFLKLAFLVLLSVVPVVVTDALAQDGYWIESTRPQGKIVEERSSGDVEDVEKLPDYPSSFDREYEHAEEKSDIKVKVVKPAPRPRRPKKVDIDELDHKRIERALRIRSEVIAEQSKKYELVQKVDPRGARELGICSVSFESYGVAREVAKMNRASFPGFYGREERLIELVKQRSCDVLAIQGVVGKDDETIGAGLEILATKLEAATGIGWKPYAGVSNHNLVCNAFMVSDKISSVSNFRSFTDYRLPKSSDFRLEFFHRGPVMLEFMLKGDGDKVKKRIVLVTFMFGKNISRKRKDLLTDRMQMAEALREILIKAKQGKGEKPVVIALGDTLGEKYSAENLILMGRLSLSDFYEDGKCRLESSQRFSCNERPYDSPVLLSAIDTSLQGIEPSVVMSKDEKEVKVITTDEMERLKRDQRRQWNYQTGIFMFPEDISLAYNFESNGSLAAGVEHISTLPLETPFLWLDLNW